MAALLSAAAEVFHVLEHEEE
jgi:hypothetical protein